MHAVSYYLYCTHINVFQCFLEHCKEKGIYEFSVFTAVNSKLLYFKLPVKFKQNECIFNCITKVAHMRNSAC